jgi:hypothetical protein
VFKLVRVGATSHRPAVPGDGTAIVRNAGASVATIACPTMHPSGDFDQAMARLAPAGQAGDIQTLAMNPVGFAGPGGGPIWFDCDDGGGDVQVSWMKISTVQVETLRSSCPTRLRSRNTRPIARRRSSLRAAPVAARRRRNDRRRRPNDSAAAH